MSRSAVLLALLVGCVPKDDAPLNSNEEESRDCQPEEVTATDAALAVADANNAFAADMYGLVHDRAESTENLFFSPFSISSALGMTLAGAEGETESQMQAVFHIGDDELAHHMGYGELAQAVFAKGSDCNVTLHMSNRLFGQTDYAWLPDFTELTEVDYGSQLEEINFKSDPEAARSHVNSWVAEETEDRIQDLLPAGSISSLTRLVLANAVYFQADWEHAFDTAQTGDADFTRADGDIVVAPMMYESIEARGALVQGTLALELDYVGGTQSMVLMMPESPDEDFAPVSAIQAGLIHDVEDALQPMGEVWVGLPRFSFEQETPLTEVLEGLGMTDAFDKAEADFTAMADPNVTEERLHIGGAFHKAFIAVDESGTEAAAATAVVVDTETSASESEFIANRPFEFYIRDNVTGTILFMGRVSDPTESGS